MESIVQFHAQRALHKNMKFFIKDFCSKCDLVTFTEEILNGKLHFCAEKAGQQSSHNI